MLLNFETENWACFRDKVRLSMQAGSEHDPDGRLACIGGESRPLKILPVAAIYGNNASGKTQLIRALSFVQNLITDKFDSQYLPVEPFLLDGAKRSAPTNFRIQFVVNETIFELHLSVAAKGIISEDLYAYSARSIARRTLFRRKGSKAEAFDEWGDNDFQKYVKSSFDIEATKSFVSVSAMLLANNPIVASVTEWFGKKLCIISPDARYMAVENYCSRGEIADKTQEYLDRFDTGIKGLVPVEVPISTLSPKMVEDVRKALAVAKTVRRLIGGNVFIFDANEDGSIRVRKLNAMHDCVDGSVLPFPMDRESDGTRRMLDLVPRVGWAASGCDGMVCVVDEIDRSLHHLVTRALVEDFIASCSAKCRNQLIFTTHDLLLMTQDIFRRDEMNVTDKAPDGAAVINDFSAFQGLKKDTNILDRYLDGRFGGIPRNI